MTAWDGFLRKIEDEYRSCPKDYLRQPTISRCLHPQSTKWYEGYFQELAKDSEFSNVLRRVTEGSTGSPYTVASFDNLSPTTVQNVHQLYVLSTRLNVSIADNDVSHIVDIGGGYGNLCKIARQVGYTGRYTIVDLPIIGEIQKDYLNGNGISGVEFMPPDMSKIKPLIGRGMTVVQSKSMLIATYSISEMPIEARQQIESCYRSLDYLYFVHNNSFDGVDNIEYFSYLKDMLEDDFEVEWVTDEHRLRVGADHRIMMCKRLG